MGDIPDYPDDFTNYPETLTSVIANKHQDGSIWTPRDAAIDFLKTLDDPDNKNIDAVIICYRHNIGGGATKTRFIQSGDTMHTVLGIMEAVKFCIYGKD